MHARLIIRLFSVIAGCVLLTGALASGDAAAKPRRIVSLNVCTDQILMMMVAPERILSVTYVATDPRSSSLHEEAKRYYNNFGAAEEVLPLEPDLVLAGQYTTRATVTLLKRLKYNVVELPVAYTLDGIRRNVRIIARAVREEARGEEIIREFDAAVGQATSPVERANAPVAALYWANSYSSGLGTLADTVIQHAGFRSLADSLGLKGAGYVPLESLLSSRPDLLVVGMMRPSEALAQQIFHHPALLQAFADHPRITVPDRYWTCGTPFTARAITQLRALREEMEGRQ